MNTVIIICSTIFLIVIEVLVFLFSIYKSELRREEKIRHETWKQTEELFKNTTSTLPIVVLPKGVKNDLTEKPTNKDKKNYN